MFESLKSFKQEPTEECEECLARDFLVDAIIDGRQKRLCNRCVIANNAIVLKKPTAIQQEIIDRPSVRDAIFRASGIMPRPLQTQSTSVKLEDLRARYEELKRKKEEKREMILLREPIEKTEKKAEVLDEKEFINYVEKLPKEDKKEAATKEIATKTEEAKQKIEKTNVLDFSPEAVRRTRIRDILERMKQMDEEVKIKEEKQKEEEIRKTMAEKTKEKVEEERQLEEMPIEEINV